MLYIKSLELTHFITESFRGGVGFGLEAQMGVFSARYLGMLGWSLTMTRGAGA